MAALARADKRLARVVRDVGPCLLRAQRRGTHFEALCRSIAWQQVTGKAAMTIFARVQALGTERRFPTTRELLDLGEARLKAAGLSRQKTAAILDLAEKCERGQVVLSRLGALPDDEVIAQLTVVRGIGRWTAQMMLIFRLGRPDVLPATDYGVQKGLMVVDKLSTLPKPVEVVARGAAWAPYRSVASWYLWRASELP